MQVKSIESILQYFRPSLSYHLSLRPLFCLFLSGNLRYVLQIFHIFLDFSGLQKILTVNNMVSIVNNILLKSPKTQQYV